MQSYNTFWVDVTPTNMLLDSALNPTFTQGTCTPTTAAATTAAATTPAPVPFFVSPLFHLLTFFLFFFSSSSLYISYIFPFFLPFFPCFISSSFYPCLFSLFFSCLIFKNFICSSFTRVSFFTFYFVHFSPFVVVGCTDGQRSFGRHLGNGPIISCMFGLSDRDGGKGCRVWQNQGMLLRLQRQQLQLSHDMGSRFFSRQGAHHAGGTSRKPIRSLHSAWSLGRQ